MAFDLFPFLAFSQSSTLLHPLDSCTWSCRVVLLSSSLLVVHISPPATTTPVNSHDTSQLYSYPILPLSLPPLSSLFSKLSRLILYPLSSYINLSHPIRAPPADSALTQPSPLLLFSFSFSSSSFNCFSALFILLVFCWFLSLE